MSMDDVIEEFFPPDPTGLPPIGPGIHLDIPHGRYLSDPCARPSLNASVANEIAAESPLHGWHMHPKLGGSPDHGSTKSMDRGSIIHKLLLGRGQDFGIVNAKDWRTSAAKERASEFRKDGIVPVLAADMEEYQAEALIYARKLKDGWGITFDGVQTEVTLVWEEGAVLCRARLDAWRPSHGELVIDDIKTIKKSNVRACRDACHRFGYDLAGAHYISGAEALVPDTEGRWNMRFIFLEGEPAYEPMVVEFAGSMVASGQERRRLAFRRWATCIARGTAAQHWPGRPRQIVRLEAAPWAAKDAADAEFSSFENPEPAF